MNSFQFNCHKDFKINNVSFQNASLNQYATQCALSDTAYIKDIGDFILNWINPETFIEVKTSGSTGKPKNLKVKKQAMINSALATAEFFKLKPKDKALHCLPTKYIAGKMMLVRAMVVGLELDIVEPSSTPILNSNVEYDFSAMVPLQVSNSLNKLHQIKTVIIGGSKVSELLKQNLIELSTKCYETYGMTETVSHVAVREIKRSHLNSNYFNAIGNTTFSVDSRNCLIIHAPHLSDKLLITNDIVKLKSASEFLLLGRIDNVINSGGVKLFPEQIEEKLQTIIDNRFFVFGEKDETLGEKLILIVETNKAITQLQNNILTLETLSKFEIPKHIYTLPKFVETETGKLNRKATFNLLNV